MSTAAVPVPTFFGALKNVWSGIKLRTAKFAGYNAATPTATTKRSNFSGTNPWGTVAQIQRVAMQWNAEDVAKNSPIAAAYLNSRMNYCSSHMRYIPNTGDRVLDREISELLHGYDGHGGVFASMGMECSMQDAFARIADIETPVRGDAGLIFWRDENDKLRLIEFSADQLGEIYMYVTPRATGLCTNADGRLEECSGTEYVYISGRYFRGADCVAYKIYQRTNAFYGNPVIYPASDVLYFRDPGSFRGVRGVTKFANALQHMQKGEQLFQIGMDAALRQAKTAMIVMNNSGGPRELSYTTQTDSDGRVTYQERLPDGPLTEYFYNGDSANFVSPDSPGSELIQGVETSDERVSLALGFPYAFLISATKVGGAPSRLEIEKANKELMRIKTMIHLPRLRRIVDVVLWDLARQGLIPQDDKITRGRWQLPISPTVDAFYSCEENIKMARAGGEAMQDIIAETNRDWEDVMLKSEQWALRTKLAVHNVNKQLAEQGLIPTVPPVTPANDADIAQISDNPQQAAAADSIAQGKPTTITDSNTTKHDNTGTASA